MKRPLSFLVDHSCVLVDAMLILKKGKLTFEVGEEKVKFILTQFLQVPTIDDTCYLVDIIDECVREIEWEPIPYSETMKIPTLLIFEDNE